MPTSTDVQAFRTGVNGVALGSVGLGGLYQDLPGEAVTIAVETFETAFPRGVRLIDTAPWYNNAEDVVGQALRRVQTPRHEYYLATKVGRYRSDKHPNGEFDYSRGRIRQSVQDSLAKLGTTYLDVVYLHDVEFVDRDTVLHEAIPALAELQAEGVIKLIGICGYPLDVLDDIVQRSPRPLQVVQSYSHLTLQNDALLTKAASWHAKGNTASPIHRRVLLKHYVLPGIVVINAAPLSMGLLTSRGPPAWHPASSALRASCAAALTWLASVEFATEQQKPSVEGLAIQYALDAQKEHHNVVTTMVVGSMGEAEVLSSIRARDNPSLLSKAHIAKLSFLLLTAPALVDAASDLSGAGLPPWVAWVTGGVLVLIVLYYCCRKAGFDESLQQPLLGGQYTEDGQPLTRQDVQESKEEIDGQWKCEVCDFHNKMSAKSCVLCGTDKGFKLGLASPSPRRSLSIKDSALGALSSGGGSFNRTRSFAIRRLNMLNSRQRGARNRGDWVRKVGTDGKRHWGRRDVVDTFLAKDPVSMEAGGTPKAPSAPLPPSSGAAAGTVHLDLARQHSLAFVSQLAQTPRHPEGRMTFKEYREVDAAVASRGYEISEQDLEILEQVAALPFKDKYSWFLEQTTSLIRPWEDGHLKMRVHRENILVESMEQLLGVQMEHIHMPLRIEFIGEVAIDAGGLEREWFALVTEKLFDETIGLFMCAHVESLAYVINPNSVEASADHLLYFRGAGRLLGRALLEGQLMKAHLALPVLKHLLGVPISFADLEFVDHEVYRSMKWMKDNEGVDALCLDFSVTNRRISGDIEVIDLKENGRHIEVTDANKLEYIYLRLRYIMLESFSEQLQHLMAGVIPQELILVFDYQELELVLCGVPSIDFADWKLHTQSSDDMPADLLVWFWEVVEGFSDEERARLLQFTTGSSRVPVQGFKALTSYDGRICHFTLKAVPYPENAFPRAHTCFNRIDLPKYKTKKEVEDVMSLVINMEVTGEGKQAVSSKAKEVAATTTVCQRCSNVPGITSMGTEDAHKEQQHDALMNNPSPSKRQAAIDDHHRKTLAAKELELRNLHKRINVYRKANAALQKELEGFHNNDCMAQVENKAREKQLLIEQLSHENKYLANLQRTQAKRIEELEALKEHFPSKHHSVMEELRICKETYRMCKEREKLADDRSNKLHQQVVDLTAKNKALADKIRSHHGSQVNADAGQPGHDDDDDDVAQLQVRVALLEKVVWSSKRTDKDKYDRVIQTCQEQLDECKREMEAFQAQLLDKEKQLRLQVVELKKLKRELRELAVDTRATHHVVHKLAYRQQQQQQPASPKKMPMPPPSMADKKRASTHVRIQTQKTADHAS
ncbi:hypothetical protein DYB30_001056 [Aphanomyces astaci]|uniref:HECT-type E3 ubiquitin transferase n=1 Tax=Aphanomyces astaci TaxID=112090 RepID=A0A397C6V6_APHAT|nr:hypothetical protein DYB30_001056 [Aphanomyces astaci]